MPTEATPAVCNHGSLRRSCEICERDKEIERLSKELSEAREALRTVNIELAALVPVPSASQPEWPEFLNDADRECLTTAFHTARSVLSPKKDQSKKETP
jgi:hypothetical protein